MVRAISLATGEDYGYIYYLLYDNAETNSCDMLNKGCYRQILEEHFGLKPRYGRGRTVDEIAKKYRDNRVIMRTQGHLTSSVNGDCFDIWDCRSDVVDLFWVVE